MTDRIEKRDIVFRKDDEAARPQKGIVIARFTISEREMDGLRSTPVEPGDYVVVTWHGRMSLRAERAEDLSKVGELGWL
jgi:hypothetical protein